MPFTTSHPALILPVFQLFRRYLCLTGLMAGAMSPDLIYFIELTSQHRGFSHSWTGLFIFCLPAGILFSFIFHRLFKREFIQNLPSPLDRHFGGLAQSKWEIISAAAWTKLALSVLVGGLSHFVWDSFTHPEGELALRVPQLLDAITLFGVNRSAARWLQHLSTVAGTLVIMLYFWKGKILPSKVKFVESNTFGQKLQFWFLGAVSGFMIGGFAIWFYHDLFGFGLHLGGKDSYSAICFGLGGWAGFFWWTVASGLLKRKPHSIQ